MTDELGLAGQTPNRWQLWRGDITYPQIPKTTQTPETSSQPGLLAAFGKGFALDREREGKWGRPPPSPALSYNVTAVCDVFAGQVALAPGGRGSAKDAPRSQTERPALRPVPFPASQRGGTRTQPAAKDIFQPFAQAAGKGSAGQEPVERPALAQRDEGDGPRRQLHVPASHRHLAPLFHTS